MTALRGVTWDHPRAYDCLVAASREFFDRTGVEIAWDKRSLQAFADVPVQTLADQYDLIVLDHPHVGQIADTGCLSPLPPMPSSASFGGSVESYVWRGVTWAWPIDAACQMAVVRSNAGFVLPATWEELLAEGAERFGMVTPLLPVDAFDAMLTLLASLGEEDLPLGKEAFCSTANGVIALRVLKRLFKLGPREAVGWNPIAALEALSTGDDFKSSPCLFGYITYARPGFRDHTLTYVDLPVFEGTRRRRAILGGAGLGVSAIRPNVEAAQRFASWVTSPEAQGGVYLRNNGQPAHRAVWLERRRDPDYSGFLEGGFETMRTAWTRPRDPWFLPFVDNVCGVITDFFLKDRDETAFLAVVNSLYRRHASGGQP